MSFKTWSRFDIELNYDDNDSMHIYILMYNIYHSRLWFGFFCNTHKGAFDSCCG